jgi:hypothetical protein
VADAAHFDISTAEIVTTRAIALVIIPDYDAAGHFIGIAASKKFLMTIESPFVDVAHALIANQLRGQPLVVRRGAVLLYQVRVDNNLRVMPQERVRDPKRGDSAFQTDLCLFESKAEDILLPRVVMEFKTGITTHDVLTYSAKAAKHKQIYPYLRYGLVASTPTRVPGRFFTHNEALDFCLSLGGLTDQESANAFGRLLIEELDSSRFLERIAFGEIESRLFRNKIVLDDGFWPGI